MPLCACYQPSLDPKVQAVQITGDTLVARLQACMQHMETAHNDQAAECDISAALQAYQAARQQVGASDIAQVQATQAHVAEVMAAAARLASALKP